MGMRYYCTAREMPVYGVTGSVFPLHPPAEVPWTREDACGDTAGNRVKKRVVVHHNRSLSMGRHLWGSRNMRCGPPGHDRAKRPWIQAVCSPASAVLPVPLRPRKIPSGAFIPLTAHGSFRDSRPLIRVHIETPRRGRTAPVVPVRGSSSHWAASGPELHAPESVGIVFGACVARLPAGVCIREVAICFFAPYLGPGPVRGTATPHLLIIPHPGLRAGSFPGRSPRAPHFTGT